MDREKLAIRAGLLRQAKSLAPPGTSKRGCRFSWCIAAIIGLSFLAPGLSSIYFLYKDMDRDIVKDIHRDMVPRMAPAQHTQRTEIVSNTVSDTVSNTPHNRSPKSKHDSTPTTRHTVPIVVYVSPDMHNKLQEVVDKYDYDSVEQLAYFGVRQKMESLINSVIGIEPLSTSPDSPEEKHHDER